MHVDIATETPALPAASAKRAWARTLEGALDELFGGDAGVGTGAGGGGTPPPTQEPTGPLTASERSLREAITAPVAGGEGATGVLPLGMAVVVAIVWAFAWWRWRSGWWTPIARPAAASLSPKAAPVASYPPR